MTTIHDCQLLQEDLDPEKMMPWDVPVDIIVTPTQVCDPALSQQQALMGMCELAQLVGGQLWLSQLACHNQNVFGKATVVTLSLTLSFRHA